MKTWHTGMAWLPILLAVFMAGAQSTPGKVLPPATQAGGFWTDPATSLMWAARDNGKDVSWKGAVKYCRDLKLANLSGWRVPSMAELEGIYDKNAASPGLMGAVKYHNVDSSTWHVKGNLFLTGDQWSSDRRFDDRGKPSGYVYYFDFNDGRPNNDPTGWPYSYVGMRVLCVHNSTRIPEGISSPSTFSPATPPAGQFTDIRTWQLKDTTA